MVLLRLQVLALALARALLDGPASEEVLEPGEAEAGLGSLRVEGAQLVQAVVEVDSVPSEEPEEREELRQQQQYAHPLQ